MNNKIKIKVKNIKMLENTKYPYLTEQDIEGNLFFCSLDIINYNKIFHRKQHCIYAIVINENTDWKIGFLEYSWLSKHHQTPITKNLKTQILTEIYLEYYKQQGLKNIQEVFNKRHKTDFDFFSKLYSEC